MRNLSGRPLRKGRNGPERKDELESMDPNELWTDYAVTNNYSGKTYRVALRGWERGTPIVRARISGRIPWEHATYSFRQQRVKKKFSQE